MIISVDEAEAAARGLRASLAAAGVDLTHEQAREHVAHAAGSATGARSALRRRSQHDQVRLRRDGFGNGFRFCARDAS